MTRRCCGRSLSAIFFDAVQMFTLTSESQCYIEVVKISATIEYAQPSQSVKKKEKQKECNSNMTLRSLGLRREECSVAKPTILFQLLLVVFVILPSKLFSYALCSILPSTVRRPAETLFGANLWIPDRSPVATQAPSLLLYHTVIATPSAKREVP